MTHPLPSSYRIQVAHGGHYEELGPLTLDELMLLAEKKMLEPSSLYFDDKENTWLPIQNNASLLQALFKTAALTPQTPATPTSDVHTYDILLSNPDKPALKEAKPCTIHQLKELFKEGKLTANTIVFDKARNTWVPLKNHPSLWNTLNTASSPEMKPISFSTPSTPLSLRAPTAPDAQPPAKPQTFAVGSMPKLSPSTPEKTGSQPPSHTFKLHSIPLKAAPKESTMPQMAAAPISPPKQHSFAPKREWDLKVNFRGILNDALGFLDAYAFIFASLICACLTLSLAMEHAQALKDFLTEGKDPILCLVPHPGIGLTLLALALAVHFTLPKERLSSGIRFLLACTLGYVIPSYVLFASVSGLASIVCMTLLGCLFFGIMLKAVTPFTWRLGRCFSLMVLGYMGQIWYSQQSWVHLSLLGVVTLGCYTSLYEPESGSAGFKILGRFIVMFTALLLVLSQYTLMGIHV